MMETKTAAEILAEPDLQRSVNRPERSRKKLFVSLVHNGDRFWLSDVENARNQAGVLFLRGTWNVDASQARPYAYETAVIIRRRLAEQGVPPTQISFVAGDRAEFIED